jgi:hypothetical protein
VGPLRLPRLPAAQVLIEHEFDLARPVIDDVDEYTTGGFR